jgi:hypothetical protein
LFLRAGSLSCSRITQKVMKTNEPLVYMPNLALIKKLSELDHETVYGVWCYGRRCFGCATYPATGKEIQEHSTSLKEFGAVFFLRSSRLPSRAFFLLEIAREIFVAAELFRGNYQPPRRVWKFSAKSR